MKYFSTLAAMAAIVLGASQARAIPIELVTNGGFETGSFAGWNNVNSGNGSWIINNGSFDPPGATAPNPPISGQFDAVTQQTGPGLHDLSQAIAMPTNVVSATLSWSDRIFNQGTVFSDPNQEFRVEVETIGGALIQQIFSTNPGDPLLQPGPNNRSFNITALAQSLQGQAFQLSFEEQDNLGFFNAYLDNVSLQVNVIPEPSSVVLAGLGGVALAGYSLRHRRRRAAV